MNEKELMEQSLLALRAYRLRRMEELKGLRVEGDAGTDDEMLIEQNSVEIHQALTDAASVDPRNLPSIVSQQFDKIAALENRVQEAKKAAEKAKDKASDAADMGAGIGKKKKAIEALQDATEDIASAQVDLVDAMNVSFEYQQQLGQIAQYLFMLGVSNIAATRTVVQRLRLELQNAPKEKMSDLARSEILTVINQLQQQEDMANRQEKQSQTLQEHTATLLQHEQAISAQGQSIVIGKKKDAEQDEALSQIAETDTVQDIRITANQSKNLAQDEQIDRLLNECAAYRQMLDAQEEVARSLAARIAALEDQLAKQPSALLVVSSIGSAIAVILGILHFFI